MTIELTITAKSLGESFSKLPSLIIQVNHDFQLTFKKNDTIFRQHHIILNEMILK